MATELGEGFRGPDGRLGYLLRQANQAFRAAAGDALAPVGITAPQYTLLSVARREPGLSGAELARDCMLTAQSTNEVVLHLERAGWVQRLPDNNDRRMRRIHVTAEGIDVLAAADARVHRLEDDIVAHLTDDETGSFRRRLVEIARRAGTAPRAAVAADLGTDRPR